MVSQAHGKHSPSITSNVFLCGSWSCEHPMMWLMPHASISKVLKTLVITSVTTAINLTYCVATKCYKQPYYGIHVLSAFHWFGIMFQWLTAWMQVLWIRHFHLAFVLCLSKQKTSGRWQPWFHWKISEDFRDPKLGSDGVHGQRNTCINFWSVFL